MVWALTTLRPYLQCESFIAYSDQASLRWLLKIANPSGRLMRWRLRLSEFDFTVQYKRGLCNTQADALPRLATLGETKSDIDDEIPCFMIEGDDIVHNDEIDFISADYAEFDEMLVTENAEPPADLLTPVVVEELLQAQAADSFCQEVRSRLNGGEELPFFDNDRGYLVRAVQTRLQIVIPFAFRARILHLEHYPKAASHPGGAKTVLLSKERLLWAVHGNGLLRHSQELCYLCEEPDRAPQARKIRTPVSGDHYIGVRKHRHTR